MTSVDGAPRQLTHINDAVVASMQLAAPKQSPGRTTTFDEDGLVTYPPDFDATKKYPMVLYIHGGPPIVVVRRIATIPQSFAAKGWIVFQPITAAAITSATPTSGPSATMPGPVPDTMSWPAWRC